MSVVTNIIIHWGCLEDHEERLKEVNSFFHDECRPGFVYSNDFPDTGWYGGGKCLETDLFIGAFNHLDVVAFIEHLKTHLHLEEPIVFQLFIQEQDDEKFSVFEWQNL